MLRLTALLVLLAVGCGETEPPQKQSDTTTPPVVEEPVPQPACFQQSTSPEYPIGMDHFNELQSPEPFNNHEYQVCAGTYDCLLERELITEEEHSCLIDDIDNLLVAMVSGLLTNQCYECGSGITCAGQIRSNVIVLNLPNFTDDTIIHECTHRAKHLLTGERGHQDPNWWHEGVNDSVCEKNIR